MVRSNFRHLLLLAPALLLLLFPSSAPDISADRAALLTFRASVRGRPLLWDVSSASPCSWPGVACSPGNSSVVALRLPGKGLSGKLPPNALSNMTRLRTLSLRSNSFSGALPSELFSNIGSLRNVYLQHNLFSGGIPNSLFSLKSLVRLNLANNNLSGTLAPSFNNLTRLRMLCLENNYFSGPIFDLSIPHLAQFNVSNNDLTGRIPKGFSGKPKSSFIGNFLCGDPLEPCGNEHRISGGAIAAIVIGCVVAFLLVILLVFCFRRVLGRKGVRPMNERSVTVRERPRIAGEGRAGTSRGFARRAAMVGEANVMRGWDKEMVFFGEMGWNFDLEDLLRASAEVLGKGVCGTSYKAALDRGPVVAVKRLTDVCVEEAKFRERMEEIGRLDHENLVPLRGYYSNREEKLLVYDYLPKGSLSMLLHGDEGRIRMPMNWEKRAVIARGAARGILYLHSQGASVSHGNIKSSNILLTKSFEACVSDFGLAPLTRSSATAADRAAAYRAPEVSSPRKISQEADVYSFGVLLLELLTGKAPTQAKQEHDLPRWVQSMVQHDEWTSEVLDAELLNYQNVEEDMVQLLRLALSCTEQLPDQRPSMAEAASKIEEICSWSVQET